MSEINRIIFLIPKGTRAAYNGAGRSLSLAAESLSEQGVDCVLLHGNKNQINEVSKVFNREIYVYQLTDKLISKFIFILKTLTWLLRNKDLKNDSVILGSTAFETTMVPATFARLLGFRVFIKIANYKSNTAPNSFLKKIIGLYKSRIIRLKLMNGIIAPSTHKTHQLHELGLSNVAHIPNGVKCKKQRKKIIDNSKLKFLYIGEIGPRKQLHLAINLLSQFDGSSLTVIGPITDAKYFLELSQKISQLKFDQRVNFLGYQETIEDKTFDKHNFFILPSSNEGMSNSMLESMANGVIPIVSDVSGVGEVISHMKDGVIIKDWDDLESNLETLRVVHNNQEALSAHAIMKISNNFSIDKHTVKMQRFLMINANF